MFLPERVPFPNGHLTTHLRSLSGHLSYEPGLQASGSAAARHAGSFISKEIGGEDGEDEIRFGTNYHYSLLGSAMAKVSLEWLS